MRKEQCGNFGNFCYVLVSSIPIFRSWCTDMHVWTLCRNKRNTFNWMHLTWAFAISSAFKRYFAFELQSVGVMLRSIFHEVFVALFFGIVFSVHLSYNETLDESVNGTASNIVLHPNIKAYNCQDDNIKVRYIDRTTIKNCSEPINEVKWFEVCAKFWFSELIGIILCYVYYFSILPKFRKRKRKFGNITYLIFNYFSDKGSSTASRKYWASRSYKMLC